MTHDIGQSNYISIDLEEQQSASKTIPSSSSATAYCESYLQSPVQTDSQYMCADDFLASAEEWNDDESHFHLNDSDSCDYVESSDATGDSGDITCTSSSDDNDDDDIDSNEFDNDSSTSSNSKYSLLSEEFIAATSSMQGASDAAMSHYECSLAIVSIAAKHNLSYSSLVDFLKLLAQLLPNSVIPKSQHMLMKQFVDYHASTTVYHCCGFCIKLLPSLESLCSKPQCQLAKAPNSMFLAVDIHKQLELLFLST